MATRSQRRRAHRISVKVTDKGPRIRRDGRQTRPEIWGAESVDGAWRFERLEAAGTPWLVTHRDIVGWSASFNSLPKARDWAQGELGFRVAVCIARAWGWR